MKGKILSAVLMAAVLLCGCENGGAANTDTEKTQAAQYSSGDMVTVSAIKAKYAEATSDNLVMPLYNVAPDEKFDFKFRYNLMEDYSGVSDFVTVHTDKKCLPESIMYTYNDYEETADGGCILTISPVGGVLENETDEADYFENDHAVWGNAAVYYIAIWYDTNAETLVKLDEPIIVPFTVKHDVPAPEVRGVVDSNGCFSLQWDPVEGADEYRVYTLTTGEQWTGDSNPAINDAETGYSDCSLLFEASTTDTYFMNFDGSGENVNRFDRSVSDKEYIIGQNYCVNGEYYVSAVIDGKESGFARAVETADLKIPYKLTDECDIMFERYTDVSELPLTLDVINIDGSITSRNVMYTFQMENTYIEGYKTPEYAFTIEGTAITGCVSMDVEDPNYEFPETVGSISATGFTEPQNNIKSVPDSDVENVSADLKDGETLVERQIEASKEYTSQGEENTAVVLSDNLAIFADSSAEEWIAVNLAGGETEISLKAFPELQIYSELEDVLNKVYYQNPYILGLYEYSYDYGEKVLNVNYVYDKSEIASRQQEIYSAADKIISEIITDDMNDSEKQLAIYEYLENNGSYDYDALENAKSNNYTKTDSADFEDSFNAYGILVKQKGVCQSYACAYKLLCSMCGLDCNVVTGYLNGSLPHAWNNVNIDGGWYQTDITNNGKSIGIPYFLYNSDTETAECTGYTEDKLYDLDSELSGYFSSSTDYEYYHANNLCASSLDEMKKILGSELDKNADVICIRYDGEMPEQSDAVKAVSEVYYGKNRENELSTLKFGMKNGFIILSN